VNSRFTRIIVALFLAIVAFGAASAAYAYLALEDGLAAVAQWFGAKGAHAVRGWDFWFFIVLCVIAGTGTVGIFLRRNWGRNIALLAFATSSMWAALMTLAPESWRGVWFSIWVDREFGATVSVLTLLSIAWLCSRQARGEFQHSKIAA
jgi:hypothetical protein